MKVPLSWLRELVDITLPLDELVHRLNMSGTEVEDIVEVGKGWEGICVATVVALILFNFLVHGFGHAIAFILETAPQHAPHLVIVVHNQNVMLRFRHKRPVTKRYNSVRSARTALTNPCLYGHNDERTLRVRGRYHAAFHYRIGSRDSNARHGRHRHGRRAAALGL